MQVKAKRWPQPLKSSQTHCFYVGWLSEEGHAEVPVWLFSHALMVTCFHFLQWIPCCVWLCASSAAWRETRTVHFTDCRDQRKNSWNQLNFKETWPQLWLLIEMWAWGGVLAQAVNDITDHAMIVCITDCISALLEISNRVLWKQMLSRNILVN